jgi:7-carboxy-7-deazaguanine synthase
MLKITEIFKSIQGETTYAGMRSTFVRFCGCNLRCSYCDTKYAYFQGKEMTVNEVFDNVVKLNCPLVTITGGEPLLQDEVYPLMDRLLSENYQVLVETNGSLPLDGLSMDVVKVLDLKCPDSGMCDRMDWNNIHQLQGRDEVKFVISSRRDYEWAKAIVGRYGLCEKLTVLMSAAWEEFGMEKIAEWILADDLNVRLQPQIHKLIWENTEYKVSSPKFNFQGQEQKS